MFKFFSKNKKGVHEESEEKFPNDYTAKIRKEDKITHIKAICKDGRLYDTKNAEKVFFNREDENYTGFRYMTDCGKTYFVTAKGNWFSAFTTIYESTEEYQEENMIIKSKKIVYSFLHVEDKEKIKILLGSKDIELYRKYFGEVEEG